MEHPHLVVRAGHPDFLDLPWEESLTTWRHERLMDLPKGVSRHEVRFVGYDQGIYAVKELNLDAASREYHALRDLEDLDAPSVRPVGLVERSWLSPDREDAAAVITEYLSHSFSYRELLSGWGFGDRRSQMLDAFAGLLAELHLLGCFWGDCSLSNVLYRYDADAIRATMVDAETAALYSDLSGGKRDHDISIMIENVAGGMADIAASQGVDLDEADLDLGEDIAERYGGLWAEVTDEDVIGPDQRFRITERIRRVNDLGFEVEDVDLQPIENGARIRLKLTVGGRLFHTRRLRRLTGVEATEHQARQILTDLARHEAALHADTAAARSLAAMRWRIEVFEPILAQIRTAASEVGDAVQAFCDLLHHRFEMASARGSDIPNDEALADWVAAGRPGYPLDRPQ